LVVNTYGLPSNLGIVSKIEAIRGVIGKSKGSPFFILEAGSSMVSALISSQHKPLISSLRAPVRIIR